MQSYEYLSNNPATVFTFRPMFIISRTLQIFIRQECPLWEGDMDLHYEKLGDIQVVHVSGRIESTTAEIFGHEIGRIIVDGNRQLLLDLSGVSYINSAGLRAILAVAKRLRNPGDRCVLCGLSDEVRRVFELAGFTKILKIYPMVGDAISDW
jgi:anti-sigma B factor antagonist